MATLVRSLICLSIIAIAIALIGTIDPAAAQATGSGSTAGAPGPIIGAGLPVLAAGYGAYWLIRRYRRRAK
jgi:hypothetical protein